MKINKMIIILGLLFLNMEISADESEKICSSDSECQEVKKSNKHIYSHVKIMTDSYTIILSRSCDYSQTEPCNFS